MNHTPQQVENSLLLSTHLPSALANFELRCRIEDLIRGWGLVPAKVVTP
jgi:hypothetical protein